MIFNFWLQEMLIMSFLCNENAFVPTVFSEWWSLLINVYYGREIHAPEPNDTSEHCMCLFAGNTYCGIQQPLKENQKQKQVTHS